MAEQNNQKDVRKAPASRPKVELIVRRDEGNSAGTGIDILNIFSFMGKKKKIYLRVIALLALIGVAVSLLGYQFGKKSANAVAFVTLNNIEANTLEDLTDSRVLSDALKASGLEGKISVDALRNNLSVERIMSEDARRELEIINSMADTVAAKYEKLLAFQRTYTNQFIISLKNGFEDDAAGNLSANDIRLLLENVLDSFRVYIDGTLADRSLPDNVLELFDMSSDDYLDTIDSQRSALQSLQSFCSKKASAYPSFRSEKDGLSFADLYDFAVALENTNIDNTYAFVYNGALTRDAEFILTRYRYLSQTCTIELAEINENIASGEKSITDYKNSEIHVVSTDTDAHETSIATTDFFNNLILKQISLYEEKAALQRRISEYQDRITRYTNASTKQSAEAENEIAVIYQKAKALYDLVCDHTSELVNSDYFSHSYFTDLALAEAGNSSSVSVKPAVICVLLGLVVWCVDGVVMELRRGKKEEVLQK